MSSPTLEDVTKLAYQKGVNVVYFPSEYSVSLGLKFPGKVDNSVYQWIKNDKQTKEYALKMAKKELEGYTT